MLHSDVGSSRRLSIRPFAQLRRAAFVRTALVGTAVLTALLVLVSAPAVESQESPPTLIDVVLQVPASLDPTIVTQTDPVANGHRIQWLGPDALKIVNFDETIAFSLAPREEPGSVLTVCNTGGTGDDPAGPWPRLRVQWTDDSDLVDDEGGVVLLDRGECGSCDGCGARMRWANDDDSI